MTVRYVCICYVCIIQVFQQGFNTSKEIISSNVLIILSRLIESYHMLKRNTIV